MERMCEIGFSHLESAHVSWIPCIFQTVLIALEKELQEESEKEQQRTAKLLVMFPKLKMNEEKK